MTAVGQPLFQCQLHSIQRTACFTHWFSRNCLNEFSSPEIDFSGLDAYRMYGWHRQLHLYEVPFYYIEYGIAQLGAIGLWKQFKQNPENAVNNYVNALRLGGTKTLPELFKTAGLQFDFSPEAIKELMEFVKTELDTL